MIIPLVSCRKAVLDALDRGDPVAVPGPPPLPYVIAARHRTTINKLKRRPIDQPAVAIVANLKMLAANLDLDDETLSFAQWISRTDLVHLTAPVRADYDSRWADAVTDGMLAFTLAWHDRLAFMLDDEHPIFASSANLTDGKPLADAAAVHHVFGEDVLIVRADPEGDVNTSKSSVMLDLSRNCSVRPMRDGFQTADYASLDDYARRTVQRYRGMSTTSPSAE